MYKTKLHYEANKPYYVAKNAERRQKLRSLIIELKSVPCTDCGNRFPYYVMDFDHVRGDKQRNISQLVHAGATDQMLAEIEKCEVVCANCHRIRTFTRGVVV